MPTAEITGVENRKKKRTKERYAFCFLFERLRELIQLRDALKPKQTIRTATVQIDESKS